MKKLYLILIALFLFESQLNAQDLNWKYNDHYKDKLLYLHAYVNYSFLTSWNFNWEKNMFNKSAVRMSFGSVEINDLLNDYRAIINVPLNSGMWFQIDHSIYSSQQYNSNEQSLMIGVEKSVCPNTSLYLQIHPAFDKEDMDGTLGLLFTNTDRTQYLQLGLCLDDFIYDSKNDLGGISSQVPVGMSWCMRTGFKKIRIFTEGKFTTGFKRKYSDLQKPPEIAGHNRQINHFITKLYYVSKPYKMAELSLHYYGFKEVKDFYLPELNYSYNNQVYLLAFKYIFSISSAHRFRFISQYVIQRANSKGWKAYEYSRNEFLPAVFYEYGSANSKWELGYMASVFEWDYQDLKPTNNYLHADYADKIKLGWTYTFSKHAKLQLSVSHTLKDWGFGGGNLQFITFF